MDLKRGLACHLADTIIPFWAALKDERHGGFIGYVGADLKADPDAPKGCIHNSRILWFFSEAYRLLGEPLLLDCADHAYRYMQRFADPIEGGLCWMVSADGEPVDQTKHTYNHAFAIYGLAAYALASGRREAIRRAHGLFELIEKRMTKNGLYADSFTREFLPQSNEKISDNPVLTARGVYAEMTMNTLLHVMEAYTLLYAVGRDVKVGERLRSLLGLIREKVYNPQKNRLEVFSTAPCVL